MKKLSQKMLAAALGISGAMVSRLKSRGMPVDSVAAASSWRKQNLNHNLVKEYRISAPDEVVRPERLPNEVTGASEIFGGAMGPEIDPVVSPPATGESYQKRLTESARREAALADIAEMNRDRQRGRLCDVESVRSVLMENYVAIRQQFERVPHELKSVISPEAFQMLSDRIRLALEAVAQAAANSATQIRELDSQQ